MNCGPQSVLLAACNNYPQCEIFFSSCVCGPHVRKPELCLEGAKLKRNLLTESTQLIFMLALNEADLGAGVVVNELRNGRGLAADVSMAPWAVANEKRLTVEPWRCGFSSNRSESLPLWTRRWTKMFVHYSGVR